MRLAPPTAVLALTVLALPAGAQAADVGAAQAEASGIRACVHRTTGALRLPATGKRCRRAERTLRLAVVGPAGAPGAPGAAGATGATGRTGPTGPAGPPGVAGTIAGVAAAGDLSGTYPNPTIAANAVTSAKILDGTLLTADLSPLLVGGAAGTPSLRALGTGALQAAAGNDARLSDARTPTGTASGDLAGTYPGPTLGSKVVAAPQVDVLPVAVARSSTLPFVDTEVFETVSMNAEDIDTTGTMHNNVTNNHQLVAPLRGLYAITIHASWNGGNFVANGYRAIRTEPAGIASTQAMVQANTGRDVQSASGVMFLEAGATVGLMGATTSPSFLTGGMSMRFISPACAVASQACAAVS